MARLGLRRRRGYKTFTHPKPPPKPPEVGEEPKKEETLPLEMTKKQINLLYPFDIPNPPSEPE